MAEMVIELNNGSEVELREVWNCCEGVNDCGSVIEIYDTETNELLTEFSGTLPDTDDEDFNMDEFIDWVSEQVEKYY